MKNSRFGLRHRSFPYVKNLTTRTKSIAVLALTLIILIYGSAQPSYSLSGADNLSLATALSINQWTNILPGASVTELAIDRTNPNIIYAGTDIGFVFKTTDGGATWTSSKTPARGRATSLAIDFVNSSNVYAGTSAGVFKSTDGGASWPKQSSLNATYVVMDPLSPNILYASAGNTNNIWKTTDGGASWPVLPTGELRLSPNAWAISPTDPQIIYAPGHIASIPGVEVYKSTDGGASWSPTGGGLSGVTDTAVDPLNPNIVYASTFQEMFKSTDGGANWVIIVDGRVLFSASQITSIAISPKTPNSLYAGTVNYEEGGVFHSTNGGASWSEFNQALISYSLLDLALDSSGSNLYAATFSGVFRHQLAEPCAAQVCVAGRIISASVEGKKLFVVGENFHPGAVILLNGVEQKTKNDPQNPQTALIGKKAGKKIKPGDTLQIRNPNGSLSQEFVFTG
jgi:photosystem II stability/assembly factor-like uncharacterized protein